MPLTQRPLVVYVWRDGGISIDLTNSTWMFKAHRVIEVGTGKVLKDRDGNKNYFPVKSEEDIIKYIHGQQVRGALCR
jgi:hypothetical protein